MKRTFNPILKSTPSNSKLVGVSIDRNGNLVRVRVQFRFKPKGNVPIFSEPVSLNPINVVWEKQAQTK